MIYGLHELLSYAAGLAEVNPFWFCHPHEEVTRVESGVVVADFDEYTMFGTSLWQPTAEGGHASLRFVDEAVAAVNSGLADAIVTGPINKVSWRMAGCKKPGHTEYLADICESPRPVMLLVAEKLKVALVTTHLPLRQVADAIDEQAIRQVIEIVDRDLRNHFGIQNPHIKVAGLNPHAGENGYLGREEIETIIPVLDKLKSEGINLSGPYPADTLFTPHMLADADAVVAMYHDQGLPVLKHAGFHNAVNTTLGLPIIRTSVDHGTALDLAGTPAARPDSLFAAIDSAIFQAHNKQQNAPGT